MDNPKTQSLQAQQSLYNQQQDTFALMRQLSQLQQAISKLPDCTQQLTAKELEQRNLLQLEID